MTDEEKQVRAAEFDDPADTLLNILAKTGHLPATEDLRTPIPEEVRRLGVLVCSVSPAWKQATIALSTGPNQYAGYAVGRAINRQELIQKLGELLQDWTVLLPPSQIVVKSILDEAGISNEWFREPKPQPTPRFLDNTSRAIRDALLDCLTYKLYRTMPIAHTRNNHPEWDIGNITSIWEALVDNHVVLQIENGEGWRFNPYCPPSPWAPGNYNHA